MEQEEEENLEAMDLKCSRKLDLNAPLLSTRRLGSSVIAETSCSSSVLGTAQNASERVPFSWEEAAGKPKELEMLKQPAEADDVFSDAMDVLCLSEALDIVQRTEKPQSDNINDGLRLKIAKSSGYQSPSYMIKRFLPDATALAASSSAGHFSDGVDKKVCDTCSSYAVSLKGCGLENLLPWRMKHKLCSIKSPVMPFSTNLHKHRRSSK